MSTSQKSQSIFSFIFRLALYLIISFFLSVASSMGWTFALIALYSFFAYLALFFVALSVSLSLNSKLKKQVVIPVKFGFFIIIFQIFLVMFNVGDCTGDTLEKGNFIQRVMAGFPECDFTINNWIPYDVIILGFLINFILLIIFTIKTLSSAKSVDL